MLKGRKGVGLMVLILVIFMVSPVSGSLIENLEKKQFERLILGNTLYVGGSGPGNYSKIQDAIDNATDGDTIYVFNGTYKERLWLKKSLHLIGEDKETTIVDGCATGHVMMLTAGQVYISNFTIQNSSEKHAGIFVKAWSDANKIINNIIRANHYGIYLHQHSIHFSFPNNVSETGCLGSTENEIIENIILVNHYGIYLEASSDNFIIRNTFVNNKLGIGLYEKYLGLYQIRVNSNNNIIKENKFINNTRNAYDRCNNQWIFNYWDDWIGLRWKFLRLLPYRIPGTLVRNFDWRPAQEPYDIPRVAI